MAPVPVGYKFSPTDEELLMYYLKPKINGEELPCDLIQEQAIYSTNPWVVFNDSSSWIITGKFTKIVFVFARLTKKAAVSCNSSSNDANLSGAGRGNYVRKAGCGTWHVDTGRKQIMGGENNIIGDMRMFNFEINDINGLGDGVDLNEIGSWKMHEYFLYGYEDYVLCRITLDTSKKPKVVRLCTKVDSGRRCGSTKPKAKKKKIATICTSAKDDHSELTESNDDQRCQEENNGMMTYQNLLALTSNGFDQEFPNKGLLQYDYDDGGSYRVEQEGQGLAANDDHRLSCEEEAQPVIHNKSEDFDSPEIILSYFSSGPNDDAYLDLEDLFNGGSLSDKDNVQQEQPMSKDDVSFDFEDLCDIGSWSEKDLEECFEQINDNIVQQQQPMQNMSCMLGKRKAFESEEDYLGLSKKFCI